MTRLIALAAALIVLVGLQAALFLEVFEFALGLWREHPSLIFALPLVGVATVLIYRRFGPGLPSTAQVLFTLTEKQPVARWLLAPFALIFTSVSQLFGASTGREGAALQIGAATADALTPFAPPMPFAREILVRGGLAAGFGAIFGTPLAGAVFAFEVDARWERARWLPWFLAAAYGSYGVRHLLVPILPNPYLPPGPFAPTSANLAALAVLALALGLFSRAFIFFFLSCETFFKRRSPVLMVLLATGALVALTQVLGTTRYNDLGFSLVEAANVDDVGWKDVLWKSLFVSLSSTSGLKGGEVTPILSIGAAMGAWIGGAMGGSPLMFLAIGLAAFFGAVAGTPIAASFLAFHFFGPSVWFPTLVCAAVASVLTGRKKLYRGHHYGSPAPQDGKAR